MIYQRLSDLTDFAFGLASWSFIVWVAMFIALYRTYTPEQRKTIAWTYTAVWMLTLLGTGNCIEWYMD